MSADLAALIVGEIEDSIAAKQKLMQDGSLVAQLAKLVQHCHASLSVGGKVNFAGSGGSLADAQHLSAELVSRLRFDRAPLASLTQATNTSAITALGTDYGYDQVFSPELEAVVRPKTFLSVSPRVGTAPTC